MNFHSQCHNNNIMGLYMYVTDADRINKRNVSDAFINETFHEALNHDPSLMIEEYTHKVSKGFLRGKEDETHYSIYHEEPTHDGSPYQARLQASGSGSKAVVIAYLHGIINGCLHYESLQNT